VTASHRRQPGLTEHKNGSVSPYVRLTVLDVRATAGGRGSRCRHPDNDVADTLSTFMRNDLPDSVRFLRVTGDLIAVAARATAGEESRVAVCGKRSLSVLIRSKVASGHALDR